MKAKICKEVISLLVSLRTIFNHDDSTFGCLEHDDHENNMARVRHRGSPAALSGRNLSKHCILKPDNKKKQNKTTETNCLGPQLISQEVNSVDI